MPDHFRAWKIAVRSTLPAAFACLLTSSWIDPARGDSAQPNCSLMRHDCLLPAVSWTDADDGVKAISFNAAEPDDFQAVRDAVWGEDGNNQSFVRYASSLSDHDEEIRPPILRAPIGQAESPPLPDLGQRPPLLQQGMDPPLAFTGRSSVLPADYQQTSDFVPIEDPW